jgi:hypothetical protein
MPDLTENELVQRMTTSRRGVEDGTLPLWTGDEPLAAYLERARALRRLTWAIFLHPSVEDEMQRCQGTRRSDERCAQPGL